MSERFMVGGGAPLGEREIGVIASTNQLARDGHILEPSGLNLANYQRNPVVLWQHIPEEPIGVCTAIGVVDGNKLAARIQFAPAGASRKADEAAALTKGGIVSGISIGFDPIECEPLDPKLGSRGGMHILTADLLEISVVSIVADTGATVVERSHRSRPGAARLLRSLPRTSRSAVTRVLDRIGRPPAGSEPMIPFGLMSSAERVRLYREHFASHATQVWCAGSDERECRAELGTHDARLRRVRELERMT